MTFGPNGNTLPDVNAKWVVLGSSVTTVVVWLYDSFSPGMDMPAYVASALTTIIAVGLGVWKGNNGTNRRSTDVPPDKS
jgi:apolipoprotein N-acyltransferase